jgi:hypothetical protein
VRVRVRGASVTVRINDGPKGEVSGVSMGSVKVSFGDGRSAHGRSMLEHTYARGGSYTIVVSASDNAGNKTTVRKVVRVS